MRLIDADALMEDINESLNAMTGIGIAVGGDWLWAKLNDAIEHAPTIEPERKTGIWLETEAAPHRIYCSACFSTYIRNKEWLAWKDHMVPRNYCPNCGAKMEEDDGKQEGEE